MRLAASAALLALAVAAFGFGLKAGQMRDFEVYWTASHRALDAEPLYREADGHYQFKYLPAFAVLTAPVGRLPLAPAKAAWFVVSVALILVLVSQSIRILPQRRRATAFLAVVTAVTMGKFFGHELVLGQVNLLFAVLVTSAVLCLKADRLTPAAGLLVAAVVVKPYAVIFLPWLAWTRGWRALAPMTAGIALVLAAPAALYGASGTLSLHAEWWRTVTASTAPNLTNNDNVSMAAFFAKWLGAGPGAGLAAAVSGVVLLAVATVTVARGRSLPQRAPLEAALLLTAIPLLSPQGWDYVFLIAAPAVTFVANYDDRLPAWLRVTSWLALATIGLSLFDILGRQRYAAFMSWSIITFCFVVVVTALAVLRDRKAA